MPDKVKQLWGRLPPGAASVLKGAAVAAAGAALTYLGQWAAGADFGPVWTPLVVTAAAVTVNAGRKWLYPDTPAAPAGAGKGGGL